MEEIWRKSRVLRSAPTGAEQRLWRHLRGRHLGGMKFRRQYPIAGHIADFVCIEAKLVIEVDGGQHTDCADRDSERTRKMQVNGYRVLRFWNDDVLLRTDAVLEEILRHLKPHLHA